ncbi:MAG TPA: cupin domain-containing protein [Candidatus Dormibacteraeota bacterium]|nr:cupin domain-containing protein [Candidatus Dormibacteraeota bacterium]
MTTVYSTHLDIKYQPLQRIDVQQLVDECTDQWWNQTLCKVNDSVVRLGVLYGEYHWHAHDNEDEFFFVVEGTLLIDVEGRDTYELPPRAAVTIPSGVRHRPRAPERVVVLMVEPHTVTPTGD